MSGQNTGVIQFKHTQKHTYSKCLNTDTFLVINSPKFLFKEDKLRWTKKVLEKSKAIFFKSQFLF